MIVIREKEFTEAIEHLLVAIKSTATDGKGLRIAMLLDPTKFGAAVLKLAGQMAYGETPYLLPHGSTVEDIPAGAFNAGDLTRFLTGDADVFRELGRTIKGEEN